VVHKSVGYADLRELVKERKDSGEDKGDLLDTMLKGRDPKTGAGLSSENIRYQLVTFLIAGHEVSGGHLC
jgi:cytochrome P450/NADPH-cytochrome P450 reductase